MSNEFSRTRIIFLFLHVTFYFPEGIKLSIHRITPFKALTSPSFLFYSLEPSPSPFESSPFESSLPIKFFPNNILQLIQILSCVGGNKYRFEFFG